MKKRKRALAADEGRGGSSKLPSGSSAATTGAAGSNACTISSSVVGPDVSAIISGDQDANGIVLPAETSGLFRAFPGLQGNPKLASKLMMSSASGRVSPHEARGLSPRPLNAKCYSEEVAPDPFPVVQQQEQQELTGGAWWAASPPQQGALGKISPKTPLYEVPPTPPDSADSAVTAPVGLGHRRMPLQQPDPELYQPHPQRGGARTGMASQYLEGDPCCSLGGANPQRRPVHAHLEEAIHPANHYNRTFGANGSRSTTTGSTVRCMGPLMAALAASKAAAPPHSASLTAIRGDSSWSGMASEGHAANNLGGVSFGVGCVKAPWDAACHAPSMLRMDCDGASAALAVPVVPNSRSSIADDDGEVASAPAGRSGDDAVTDEILDFLSVDDIIAACHGNGATYDDPSWDLMCFDTPNAAATAAAAAASAFCPPSQGTAAGERSAAAVASDTWGALQAISGCMDYAVAAVDARPAALDLKYPKIHLAPYEGEQYRSWVSRAGNVGC